MTLFLLSFVAGVLTVLAPCILPLLPVIIGSSVGARSKATPYIVIGSLALSILLFTYLLKASTAFIAIPTYVWGYVSGGILIIIGLIFLWPQLWEQLSFVRSTSAGANKLVGAGHQQQSVWGDVLIGAALGPVFSSCSPTYFLILATVLPASFALGTLYLVAYIAGLVLVLVLIAVLGQRFTAKLQWAADSRGWFKRGLGALFLMLGIIIATGTDKAIETWLLDRGYLGGVQRFEQQLIDEQVRDTSEVRMEVAQATASAVPRALQRVFPETDFTQADPDLANALSGGPPKDGIPAIDEPTFVPLRAVTRPDTVQAIVLETADEVKVYPYNILTWHEIVNDTVDGTPVAITFCPLCGSAIVFDRTLPDGAVSTFGVSGWLLESNMIMFDRTTETLWQQSTGAALAGTHVGSKLELVPFQLLTLGEVRRTFPNAQVLSEATGHQRDYGRNPYAGYETDNRFVFEPSGIDTTLPPKEIMVVLPVEDSVLAASWQALRSTGGTTHRIGSTTYTFSVDETGQLTVVDDAGDTYPFYFEMWFSAAVQHGEQLTLVTV
jgi:cytochrome c biogenesis protein CcdA